MALPKAREVKFQPIDLTSQELKDMLNPNDKTTLMVMETRDKKQFIVSGKMTPFDPKKVTK